MGAMTKKASALKAESETAILAEVERAGPEAVNRDVVVKRFIARGVAQSTAYRWFADIMKSGRVGAHLASVTREAVDRRASLDPNPAESAAREAVEALPAVMMIGDDLAPGAPEAGIQFIKRLQECLAHGDELLQHARTADGKIRNSRLVLSSAELVRRTLESAARIQDTVLQMSQVEQFHQAVFDALREESPEFAERVLVRLRQLNAAWSIA